MRFEAEAWQDRLVCERLVFGVATASFVNDGLKLKNREKDWYIGRQVDLLTNKIPFFNPLLNITRLPRGINCIINCKSHEWRNFNLYYGPFILQDSLPRRYYSYYKNLLISLTTKHNYAKRIVYSRGNNLSLNNFIVYMV